MPKTLEEKLCAISEAGFPFSVQHRTGEGFTCTLHTNNGGHGRGATPLEAVDAALLDVRESLTKNLMGLTKSSGIISALLEKVAAV